MSTWGKINGDKEESMGTNSGGGWVHGGKDMGNGEGRGKEFGNEGLPIGFILGQIARDKLR